MLLNLWNRLNFAQALAAAATIAGGVCLVVFAPAAFWKEVDAIDWRWLVGALLAAAGAGSSAMLGRLIHEQPVRGASLRPPAPSGEDTPTKPDRPRP